MIETRGTVTVRHVPGVAMRARSFAAVLFLLAAATARAQAPRGRAPDARRPPTFVSIADVDPTILVELRYAGTHNFVGRPVVGYRAARCLLTRPAALALKAVQGDLRPYGLSVKVYDCYRPQRAVDAFIAWARDPEDAAMRAEFYPRVPKRRLFAEGYLAERSGHSRGSTVDLTIVQLPRSCRSRTRTARRFETARSRRNAGSETTASTSAPGTIASNPMSNLESSSVPLEARVHRLMLRAVMEKHGFRPAPSEWWHFTLVNEPYPGTYFDFVVE